ncbi:hypothetical protein OGAPHI_007460 [Ogataea philodendri]|uniref:Uncharacterized protein n=1 Tax=Ogataea philodendri TaxID=1378263 RepID=A0A9P8NV35_9ASCO|nr:uncharacterized protein OGAPHI_007460 [Ogataea philodendri]KAH3660255.1 hypothetical protein OGAPHI_007460 [Ogataea philodendri]
MDLGVNLLVDPSVQGWLVLDKLLLLEPQGDLLLSTLNRVGTVNDVSAHVQGEVTSDGTWSRLQWVGGTKQNSSLLDDILTFPNGGQDWAREHVRQQGWEEWLGLQVRVVFSQQRLVGQSQLDTNKLESLVLESSEDLWEDTSLDSVWLDCNESSLGGHVLVNDDLVEKSENRGRGK